jgi:hypothetical protein
MKRTTSKFRDDCVAEKHEQSIHRLLSWYEKLPNLLYSLGVNDIWEETAFVRNTSKGQSQSSLLKNYTCKPTCYGGSSTFWEAWRVDSVADSHHFDEDLDPACPFNADPDLDPAVTLMRIRILPFPLKRIQKNFENSSIPYILARHLQIDTDPDNHFDADTDPADHVDADPDPTVLPFNLMQIHADPDPQHW